MTCFWWHKITYKVTKVKFNIKNVYKCTFPMTELCGKAFIQQSLFQSFYGQFALFSAVTMGHQWNPFVIAKNQSRAQLQTSAKKQALQGHLSSL